jgi:hypothetical protein
MNLLQINFWQSKKPMEGFQHENVFQVQAILDYLVAD